MKKNELTEKIKALGEISEDQKRHIVCSLVGHSNIQTTFFGYYYCGRCGDQVGDSLGSTYINNSVVIVGHNCDECRENYKKLKWEDKYLAPDPFKEDK